MALTRCFFFFVHRQLVDNSGLHEDENTKKRREILARRPSYRKILNELGGCEISGKFLFFCTLAPSRLPSSTLNALLLFCFSFFFIVEDKGDSPGIDSDSSSSSPAPPSSHNQRTASSVSISGTHYHQTTAGLIKGIIRTPKMLALSSYLFYFFLPSLFCFVFFIFQTTHCWYIYFSNNLQL